MTLDELLYKFESPKDAAVVSGMSRTAAYHWFASGNKRVIPPSKVIIQFCDFFLLSNEQLGLIIRNCEFVRGQKVFIKKKRKKKAKKVPVDWEANERYLEQEENVEKVNIFEKLSNIITEYTE
tara:strand:+ start:2721 stop:3089 length:369 start_codon:yes stop_codon:yes gene_type:complete